MRIAFLAVFITGLALGVISMIAGIDRDSRHGGWVKFVNLPIVATGATLFGLVGYPLAKYGSLGAVAQIAIAGGAALAGAGGMMLLIAGWAVPSARREVPDARFALQGHLANVSGAIEAGRSGHIAFEEDGVRHTHLARSLDGGAIEAGADVVIERIEDGVAYVERWTTIARQLELPS